MYKTFKISFSLKNTYRVNSILYSLKQIPLLKKLLPESLYRVKGLKVFGNVLSVVWEIFSAFSFKYVYLAVMVAGADMLYKTLPQTQLFLHILVFLSFIGAFMNTYMFNPGRDKYYAIVLMRIDAKSFTLVDYVYALLKSVIGFLPFIVLLGLSKGVPLWLCLLAPFFIVGLKATMAAVSLLYYEKTGKTTNENMPGKCKWLAAGVLLTAAYGLPALNFTLPIAAVAAVMVVFIISGIFSLCKIFSFSAYREMYQLLLAQSIYQMDHAIQMSRRASQKAISSEAGIISHKKGFEYLNELFIKRHRKILWKASKRIAAVCLCLVLGMLLAFYLAPEIKEKTNEMLLSFLPCFLFVMYAINRGTGFTKALFMNCDHSLLTYSFYKQPRFILKLFQIRLREIVKVNLLPALVIGAGVDVLLYFSGGTNNPLDYAVLFVSILCMSIFFSVHYLTIYYLLQPYNAGTEMKSGTYQLVLSGTYLVCFFMMQVKMAVFLFGMMTIVFCLLYCLIACILIYRFAPQTFRLRT